MKKSNRLLAIMLALAMIVTYMPALAFAQEDSNNQTFDVDEEVFYSNGTDLNSHRAIPGMTLSLKATVYDWAWDDDIKDKHFTYSWSLVGVDKLRCWIDDGQGGHEEILEGYTAADFVTLAGSGITASAVFKTKEAVTSGKSPEDKAKLESAYDMGFRINFKVTATRAGESHDRVFDIWVSNDYYEVEPVSNPLEGMVYGNSVTIEPKLFHITGVDTKNQVTDNVEWKLAKHFGDEWDDPWDKGWNSIVALNSQDQDFPVTVPQAGKYTIKRNTFNEARIVLWAKFKVPDNEGTRDEYEDADYWVEEQENDLDRYEVKIEGADENNAIRVPVKNNISLNVSVSNDRFTLPENAYDVQIFKESWGTDGKQILTPLTNGQLALDEETGTVSIIVYASARDNSGYTGHTFFEQRGDEYDGVYFDIYHINTLSPFNPKIEFTGYKKHQGESPMVDYYWFSADQAAAASAALKVSIGSNVLTRNTDYIVKYYAGDDEVTEETQLSDTFPTDEGTYSVLIMAAQGSVYTGRNDTTKFIIMSSGDEETQRQAENVRDLIERIQVWAWPEGMNRSAVGPARTAYNALSAAAKELVYDRWYAQLEDAEFIILMDAVDVNNPSEASVKAAREQYNKASKVELYQYWMPEELVEKLNAAEKKIADRKDAEARAAEAKAEADFNGTPDRTVPKAKSVKAKAAKKSFTVSWKKADKKTLKKYDAIEVQYSLNPNFPRKETESRELGKKKKSLKIKGLAKGTYYVRVRYFKKGGSTGKLVGQWTKKKVKVKK